MRTRVYNKCFTALQNRLSRRNTYQLVVESSHQQDSADERRVVVGGMELRRGEMERSGGWEGVAERAVDGQQVDVVHRDVVAAAALALDETDVDEHGAVEPATTMAAVCLTCVLK